VIARAGRHPGRAGNQAVEAIDLVTFANASSSTMRASAMSWSRFADSARGSGAGDGVRRPALPREPREIDLAREHRGDGLQRYTSPMPPLPSLAVIS
jgi:hypothetical protein